MKRIALNFFWLLIIVSVANAWGFTPEDCVRCHANGSQGSKLHIDVELFKASVHGSETTCLDCHEGIRDENHETDKSQGLVDCGVCHEVENNHGVAGDSAPRPQCYSCHTKHAIFAPDNPLSSLNTLNLRKTCNNCHPVQCGNSGCLAKLASFRISSHKKGNFSCSYSKYKCLDCHQGRGAHGEAKVITQDNCYQCHLSLVGKPLLLGYIHPREKSVKSPGFIAIELVYLLLIFLFFVGGFIFYSRKFSHLKRQPKGKKHC